LFEIPPNAPDWVKELFEVPWAGVLWS
jgi:hypothetical protein